MQTTRAVRGNSHRCGQLALGLLFSGLTHSSPFEDETSAADQPATLAFSRTEQREPCANYQPTRQPLFGDLHVHTSFSHDAYVSMQRNDPWHAYRYAKGESLPQPDADGQPTVQAQISKPLDFTAVTDHAEYFGELNLCTRDSSKLAYWMPQCMLRFI